MTSSTTDISTAEADGPSVTRRRLIVLGALGIGAVAAGSATDAFAAASRSTKKSTKKTATAAATTSPTTTSATSAAPSSLARIPEETAGPYPGDGSNGLNVLAMDGIVRSDIRSSFGSSSTTAKGVKTSVQITVISLATRAPLVGAAIYLWHCDQLGRYSGYSQGITNENYLRGVQPTDGSGLATFLTNYPGAYDGRWPHIHFEVYPSVAKAVAASGRIVTSQIAMPESWDKLVYTTSEYGNSLTNLSHTSLATDMVFSDGSTQQLAQVSGTVADGLVAKLTIGV